MAFSSAVASGKRELVIKSDSASQESSAVRSGEYDDLFTVSTLNHLQVTGFSELTSFSEQVGRLEGLFQLILTQNSLVTIPSQISTLAKLKHLDISQNKISTLPASLYSLHALHTLIASHNALTDDSFPPAPEGTDFLSALPNLHHVDLLDNQLTKLPDFVYGTHHIQELIASDNSIATLEPSIGALLGLKHIDLKRNQLRCLPRELTTCTKLRVMRFEENPIGDRRLLKLVTQLGASKPKAVLDYIASHTPKTAAPAAAGKRGKGKGAGKSPGEGHTPTAGGGESDKDDEGVVFAETRTQIQISRPAEHVQITASAAARAVRPYLVCAIVRGVDLADELAYKEFITLQTKLHDTVCKRRRVATIATHNLNAISPPLRYSCDPAPSITFTPLNATTPITVERFLATLEASKQESRRGGGGGGKGKKGGQAHAARPAVTVDPVTAALSKYLQFVSAESMVYLQDKKDTVISLPPLTNSEISKIDNETTDLFLEVTSAESLGSCKTVMDSLVCGMCERGLGVRGQGRMVLEQVRVVDESGQLLVLYPSRTDLTQTNFDILRPQ